MDNQHTTTIDAYLRDELSASEKLSFEGEMARNPELLEEFNFQKELTQGLTEYRKAELRSRLNALEVPSLASGGEVLGKIAAGVVAGCALVSGYFLLNSDQSVVSESQSPVLVTAVDGPAMYDSYRWDIPEIERLNADPESISMASESESIKAVVKQTSEDKKPNGSKSFKPDLSRPAFDEPGEEEEFKSQSVEVPVAGRSVAEEIDEEPIDVKTYNRKGQLKYKYYDGKLFLYGDFKKEPYEILEINSESGREVFLFYQDEYYPISIANEVSELNKIVDQKSISKLEIIRSNK